MTKVGPRTYRIDSSDHPIIVRIKAKQMDLCQAVVSDALFTRGGAEVDRLPVTVQQPTDDPLVREFTLPQLTGQSPLDTNVTVHGFFATTNGPQPCYELTITAGNGDEQRTKIRKPTVDPGVAHLTFELR
jgi:hypothetical protein